MLLQVINVSQCCVSATHRLNAFRRVFFPTPPAALLGFNTLYRNNTSHRNKMVFYGLSINSPASMRATTRRLKTQNPHTSPNHTQFYLSSQNQIPFGRRVGLTTSSAEALHAQTLLMQVIPADFGPVLNEGMRRGWLAYGGLKSKCVPRPPDSDGALACAPFVLTGGSSNPSSHPLRRWSKSSVRSAWW